MKRVVWKRFAAAVAGKAHNMDNTPCQDSTYTVYRRNVCAIALSDGAGSAHLSRNGSKLCAQTLCAALCRHFNEVWNSSDEDAAAKLLQTIRNRFAAKADELDAKSQDLAATALAVAVNKNRYIAIHLGDGVIGVEITAPNGERQVDVLSAPDNGEHSNETFFVTSSSALAHMRIYKGKIFERPESVVSGFILMSDGPEAALYRKTDNSLAPACAKLLESARSLQKKEMMFGLRGTVRMISQTKTHDDCSIALMAHI